jgi:archaemetzincin
VDESLQLVPIYCGDRSSLVEPLARRLEEIFHVRAEVHPPSFDPELAYDSLRGQYNSRVLLAQLLREPPSPPGPEGARDSSNGGFPPAHRILGVANVDLFIPVLTFVYGEAQLDNRAAVTSAYRLDNELYGLPADPHLLFERLVTEAVHELGHTYGLLHCIDNRCVMASSTYVEEIDLKSPGFCDRCLAELRRRRLRPERPAEAG